ncbi:MAG: hypothetical protein NTX71_00185 [Candidatus Aureabacteria bacterium]|nr:hypothetical protein [Candidatus Auribacterota bacterium]
MDKLACRITREALGVKGHLHNRIYAGYPQAHARLDEIQSEQVSSTGRADCIMLCLMEVIGFSPRSSYTHYYYYYF